MEAVATEKDLTKKKLLKKLKQREEKIHELQKKNELLKREAELSEKANKTKSEFLSHMSHDIRTPINGIVGMTNIAINHIDDSDRVLECLKKIDSSSRHLISLVNDVLDMSRIESGRTVINHEPMDMRKLLDDCAQVTEGLLANRSVELIREFDVFKYPFLLGDELHLRQILINILGNAVKFTPDGGKIYFQVKENRDGKEKAVYRFVIEDTGIGMKQSFLKVIWDSFSQENNGNYCECKGTGLGMSITKKLVDLMHGSITAESKMGVGSCFTVELTFDVCPKTKGKTVSREDNRICLKGKKILLVEDVELNMEIVQIMLEEEGIGVVTAENGQRAVNIFSNSPENSLDAILMDIRMPVMDGLTATRAIRELPRADAAEIPIIAMTADAYEEDIRKALDAGMNAHLAKPVSPDKLFQKLRTFCSEKKGSSQ